MSTAAYPILDSLQKREVERQLAGDLQLAHEARRILKMRIADTESNTGVASGLAGLSLADLEANHAEAVQGHHLALQRFVDFVTKGIVPPGSGVNPPLLG